MDSIRNNKVLIKFIVICGVFFKSSDTLSTGDSCDLDGVRGVCQDLRNCEPVLNALQVGSYPQICSYEGLYSIVCCPFDGQEVASTQRTTTRRSTTARTTTRRSTTRRTTTRRTTTEYVPVQDNYDPCPPLPSGLNKITKKTGRKAIDKCLEYQDKLLPCLPSEGLSLAPQMYRSLRCGHDIQDLIINGVDAKIKEFPHMALLGFGSDAASAKWDCGGTLISERFVVTAGHCTSSRENGPVTFVRLGVHRMSSAIDPIRTYKVEKIIKHPDYKPPIKYNDIALLQLDREVKLDSNVMPACLDTGVSAEKAVATGWGVTTVRGTQADVLQKVVLEKFTDDECKRKLGTERLMKQGVQPATQVCYGHKSESKDACQGDSGGPLQIYDTDIFCMYKIVGVTSNGKGCGNIDVPGIYTRISTFTPWIESIVWP